MPLVFLAACSYAAGLLAGFAGSLAGATAVAGVAILLAVARREARAAALAALFLAGAFMAAAREREDAACRTRIERAHAWEVALGDAVAPGAYVVAEVRAGSCRQRAAVAVERGAAPAGAVVVVRGTAMPGASGVRIVHALVLGDERRAVLPVARAAIGRRIDALYGGDAPLVRALLIADMRALDPALRDRFAAAGIAHVLSISGLHVAIIAGVLLLAARAARIPHASAAVATLVVTAAYVAIIGAPAPAVRAGVMLAVLAASRLAQRPTSSWAALALGGGAPLVDSRVVLDPGWQLSVLGMASLIAAGVLARRWVAPRWSGWRGAAARVLLVSTVATLASAPLVAWRFGRVSVVAPLTNVATAPLVAVLQPTLFASIVASPLAPVARLLADAAHPMLAALDALAAAGAAVPFAALAIAPTAIGAALAALAAVGMLAACASTHPARPAALAVGALAAAMIWPLVAPGPGHVELHAIDVGQGDAIALRTPAGRWVLIDAGRAWTGGDAGRATVVPYLRRYGGDVVLFALTHPHTDHVGGASSVIRALRPSAYWDAAFAGDAESYRASLVEARRDRVQWRRARPGDSLVVDGLVMRALAPDSAWESALADPNDASLVVLARYGRVRFLLMGDAEAGEEAWLLACAGAGALRADVLKVGHHGSSTSSTTDFLAAVHPRVALVSVGAGNSYGHPSPGIMARLDSIGARVWRTDRAGAIVVSTDGERLTVRAGGGGRRSAVAEVVPTAAPGAPDTARGPRPGVPSAARECPSPP